MTSRRKPGTPITRGEFENIKRSNHCLNAKLKTIHGISQETRQRGSKLSKKDLENINLCRRIQLYKPSRSDISRVLKDKLKPARLSDFVLINNVSKYLSHFGPAQTRRPTANVFKKEINHKSTELHKNEPRQKILCHGSPVGTKSTACLVVVNGELQILVVNLKEKEGLVFNASLAHKTPNHRTNTVHFQRAKNPHLVDHVVETLKRGGTIQGITSPSILLGK